MSDRFTTDSLRTALGVRPFRFFEQVGSTQDIAREWARTAPEGAAGAVVIAEHQTAGRGRQGRAWYAPPGTCIMCSIILQPHILPAQVPRLTMVGGLAVARTLGTVLPDVVALKWPNDVLVRGRKIAGVLAEAVWIGSTLQAVILGIGLNVRVDFSSTDLDERATSLEPELGRPVDRHAILANLLSHVFVWAGRVHDPALVETWRGWLGTLGKYVKVTVNPQKETGESFGGVAEAVDDNGALLVRLDSGELRRVIAADVALAEV